jgi:tRNA 2-thiouridine synthesizing protein E
MSIIVRDNTIDTDFQGFLQNLEDWTEEYATAVAERDGIELFNDHWELIWYFREYFAEEQKNPTMHTIVRNLGKMKGGHFHDQKAYEQHIYHLFPSDPVHEICKLAGLPMPPPDT